MERAKLQNRYSFEGEVSRVPTLLQSKYIVIFAEINTCEFIYLYILEKIKEYQPRDYETLQNVIGMSELHLNIELQEN